MNSVKYLTLGFFLIFCSDIFSQPDERSWRLNGYLSSMQMVMFEDINKDWITENLFHNRLNLYWYPHDNFTGTLQVRNRFIYGETVKYTQDYAESIGKNDGWADLSFNVSSGNSYVLNSTIDRLWFQYTRGSFSVTAGRQRINWGQTLVWNPNDIFNVYSYFDFDYQERPGSDALRLQYYPGFTSSLEMAVKIDSAKNLTAAGLFRFNKWNYDFQLTGGVLNSEDYVAGFGWSGNLKSAAFRGEATYFRSIKHFEDTSGYVLASIGFDYVFNNSLMIQGEFLYSNFPIPSIGFLEYYSGPLNVKMLAFTKYSVFGALSYPFTPLFQGSFAAMYFPKLEGYFSGPSLSYNLLENLDLSFFLQYFSGKIEQLSTNEKKRQNITLGFIRLRWNF